MSPSHMKHVNLMIPESLHKKLIEKLPEKRLLSLVIRQLIREYVNGTRGLKFEDLEKEKNL